MKDDKLSPDIRISRPADDARSRGAQRQKALNCLRDIPLPELHDVPDNGLARTPPMGWNSWNKFAGKVTDDGRARNGGRHGVERHEGCRLHLHQY